MWIISMLPRVKDYVTIWLYSCTGMTKILYSTERVKRSGCIWPVQVERSRPFVGPLCLYCDRLCLMNWGITEFPVTCRLERSAFWGLWFLWKMSLILCDYKSCLYNSLWKWVNFYMNIYMCVLRIGTSNIMKWPDGFGKLCTFSMWPHSRLHPI